MDKLLSIQDFMRRFGVGRSPSLGGYPGSVDHDGDGDADGYTKMSDVSIVGTDVGDNLALLISASGGRGGRPQFFKADGSDDGAEFLVNANSAGDQDSVTLAVLTNGYVVLAGKMRAARWATATAPRAYRRRCSRRACATS